MVLNMDIGSQKWLASLTWNEVVLLNTAECQKHGCVPSTNPATFSQTRIFWDNAATREMSLKEALGTCRYCLVTRPFQDFNEQTFSGAASAIVRESLKNLPQERATAFDSITRHYVLGTIGDTELDLVLNRLKTTGQTGLTKHIHNSKPQPPFP